MGIKKKVEMMRLCWIIQISPESTDICPCGGPTEGRCTEGRHTEEEAAM